jgi:hypothetical protein
MSANPYAPPQAGLDINYVPVHGCWRVGRDLLFVQSRSDLPQRCVKCNGEVHKAPKLRSFYWHASGWYALIVVSIFIYAVAAMVVRKKVQLSPGLCAEHASQRSRRAWGAVATLLGGCVAAWIAAGMEEPWLAFFCFFGGLVGGIAVAMSARIIYPVGVDDRGARFKGCGPAFLDSLEGNRPF